MYTVHWTTQPPSHQHFCQYLDSANALSRWASGICRGIPYVIIPNHHRVINISINTSIVFSPRLVGLNLSIATQSSAKLVDSYTVLSSVVCIVYSYTTRQPLLISSRRCSTTVTHARLWTTEPLTSLTTAVVS